MAASSPESRCRRIPPSGARVLAAVLGLFVVAPAYAQQQAITLDAASSDFDRRNERLVFTEVRIQQGDLVISAAEAESRDLDFSRGSWLFRGDVRITSPMGDITSDRATITFLEHRLSKATTEGAPAQFSRTMPDDGRLVTGTANRIDYDLSKGELVLAGQAALRDGVREVSGGQLVYRIAEDRLIASTDAEGAERVRIVITPPEEERGEPREDGP
ncbi:MAG: lipopolysaccharide transport periplasmic protein LptA [Gammaproteobacteria bacterium]